MALERVGRVYQRLDGADIQVKLPSRDNAECSSTGDHQLQEASVSAMPLIEGRVSHVNKRRYLLSTDFSTELADEPTHYTFGESQENIKHRLLDVSEVDVPKGHRLPGKRLSRPLSTRTSVRSEYYRRSNSMERTPLQFRADAEVREEDGDIFVLPKLTRAVILFGLCLAWFARGADTTMTTTLATTIVKHLDALDLIGWFSAADLFPQAILSVGFGKLATMVRLPILAVWGNILFVCGRVICMTAQSGIVFVLGRLLGGTGSAMVMAFGAVLITKTSTPSQRPLVFSMIVGVDIVALGFGSLIGGYFSGNYRWSFAVPICLGTVGVALILAVYREPKSDVFSLPFRERVKLFDPLGFVLLLAATTMPLVGLQLQATGAKWTNPTTLALFTLGVLAASAFVLQQKYHPNPASRFLPPSIFSRDVTLVLLMGFFVVFNTFQTSSYLSTYFQMVQGLTAFKSGVAMLGLGVPTGAASIITGFILGYVPYVNIILVIATPLSIIGQLLLYQVSLSTTTLQMSCRAIVPGAANGALQMLGVIYSQQWVSEDLRPFMASFALTMQYLGGVLGPVLGELLLNTQIRARLDKIPELSAEMKDLILQDPGNFSLSLLDKGDALSVVQVFLESHRVVFFSGVAAAVLSFMMAVHIKWHRAT